MNKKDLNQNPLGETEKSPLSETEKGVADTSKGEVFSQSTVRSDLKMYAIKSVLGHGSAGIVYRGEHKKLGRQVAIKMLHPENFTNPEILEGFRKEARILSRIKHENVASVYDFIETCGRYYLIMELIDGHNLAERLKKKNLSPDLTLKIIKGILEGIRFTHNKEILHLDLKPSNIILNEYDEPVIVDFGISRFRKMELNSSDIILGTPYYMAPEQILREPSMIDSRTDIFTLGVVFYELLTGKLPFKGKGIDSIKRKILNSSPKKIHSSNNVPLPLEAIIFKMMKKIPRDRYDSAQEVLDDLKRFSSGEPVKALKYQMRELVWSWIKRNPLIFLLLSMVIIATVSFFSYFSYKKHLETPHWKKVFSDNFNSSFQNNWEGYTGMVKGFPEKVSDIRSFNNFFANRIKTASFKKEEDLILTPLKTFDENLRMSFQWNLNPSEESFFGLFINADINSDEWGYLIIFHKNKITLVKDNIHNTPLWEGEYIFQSNIIYNIEIEIIDGRLKLVINDKPVLDFQDFVSWFTKKDYKAGFFSTHTDLEVDNLEIFQLNDALLITPLDIGNRFFQLNRYEDASQEYERVISKYPEHRIAQEAYYLQGLAFMKLKKYKDAIKNFDILINRQINASITGKSYFQKGISLLNIDKHDEAFAEFNLAMKVYGIHSLRSNLVGSLIDIARKSIDKKTNIKKSIRILEFLYELDIPSRITFVDIPKNIILHFFNSEEYQKALPVIDLLLINYPSRDDIQAFALWQRGRSLMMMKDLYEEDNYLDQAIMTFKDVLKKCPDIEIYNYFAYDELAKAYRAKGDYKLANEYEKCKSMLSDDNF